MENSDNNDDDFEVNDTRVFMAAIGPRSVVVDAPSKKPFYSDARPGGTLRLSTLSTGTFKR